MVRVNFDSSLITDQQRFLARNDVRKMSTWYVVDL